jgi:UbiD family decarboxylase
LPHAAETLYMLRQEGLPIEMCWMVLESACHWLVIAAASDWHERTNLDSKAFCERIGSIVFSSKAGFGVAKILLVENDIDISNVDEVVWAFASRAHPAHGEIYFKNEAQNALPVFLDPDEKHTFRTVKVIHNALLADRFPPSDRPQRSDLVHGWPVEIRERVLRNWSSYGYR